MEYRSVSPAGNFCRAYCFLNRSGRYANSKTNSRIKYRDQQEALREQEMSKEKTARIANSYNLNSH